MDIGEKHIASKRRVGTLKGRPVVELITHGGLHLVVCEKNGKVEIIGSGPHRAVSRYIAERREPDLIFSELSKSDWIDEAAILSVYQKYLELVNKLNDLISRG